MKTMLLTRLANFDKAAADAWENGPGLHGGFVTFHASAETIAATVEEEDGDYIFTYTYDSDKNSWTRDE